MNNRNSPVPNAWDDVEFSRIADTKGKQPATTSSDVKIPRSERRAQHEQANKQLWEAAENPETFHFVEAKNNVPLKTEFRPTVKVLSRKPKVEKKPVSGVEGGVNSLSIQDEEDSEEEARKAQQASFAERQEKARLERLEKEKRYAEARERLFGSPAPSQGEQTGRGSPTSGSGRARQGGRGNRKGGRGRTAGRTDSNQTSSADQSPVRAANSSKQLFDPHGGEKPDSVYQQRRSQAAVSNAESVDLNKPVRNPRGPDGSGRGGFGFRSRGGPKDVT